MAKDPLIFKDAEKARNAITQQQKAKILNLYQDWANEIGKKAKEYSHKTAPSYAVAERQMKELEKQLRATSDNIANEIYGGIKQSIYTVSESVVNTNKEWLKSLGFEGETLDIAFNYVPDEIVQKLVTGQIYDSGWSLSKRIWGNKEETLSELYKVTAGGVAQNKSIYEIAKDLEKYISPTAAKPWNLIDKDGRKIYPKQVDYNAQRLARTLVQHGYQQSFVETTKENPFITDYIWRSNGSRVCELCISRDGQHFSKDELPMDHPNGMCTMEPNVSENMIDDLADWFNSPDGTFPEIDEFAKSLGYEGETNRGVKTDQLNMDRPSTLSNISKHEKDWYDKNIATQFVGNEQELITLNNNLKNLIESNEFCMKVPDDSILNIILDEGKFKSYFETNTTMSTFDMEQRKSVANQLFGIDSDKLKSNEFEKYGYLGSPNLRKNLMGNHARTFGDITVRFKKSNLMNKTTMVLGDSGPALSGEFVATSVTNPMASAIPKDQVLDISKKLASSIEELGIDNVNKIVDSSGIREYIELQYHGDLTIDDIESIAVFNSDYINKSTISRLKDMGIKVDMLEED